MNITITHTIYRGEDQEAIELEVTGTMHRYGLDDYKISAPHEKIVLTDREDAAIIVKLTIEAADDWDEGKWKADRESAQ